MKKNLALPVILLLFTAGCARGPYVYLRSDIFADSKTVKSVYIMPVVTEITVDSQFDIDQRKFQKYLQERESKIDALIASEFSKRGYACELHHKKYRDLDENDANDRLIKSAVQEFLASSAKTYSDDFEFFLKSIILEKNFLGELTITDKDGNKRKVNLKEAIETEEKKEEELLVSRTLDARNLLPGSIDTVSYIKIKSNVAKRGFIGSLREESTVIVTMKLVNLKEERVVFSYGEKQYKRDIYHWKTFEKVLAGALEKIPLKVQ